MENTTEKTLIRYDGQRHLAISIASNGRAIIESKIDDFARSKEKPLQQYYREFGYQKLNGLDKYINGLYLWWGSPYYRDVMPTGLTSLEFYKWENDSLVVDESFFEDIRPHFETWAITDKKKELFDRYLAIAENYNSFYQLANEEGYLVPDTFTSLFGVHGQLKVEKVKPTAWFFPVQLKSFQP